MYEAVGILCRLIKALAKPLLPSNCAAASEAQTQEYRVRQKSQDPFRLVAVQALRI